jgi:hypothetical protein
MAWSTQVLHGFYLLWNLYLLTRILDVKLDNVFVNYGQNEQRFSEIQLGDCGGVVSKDSEFAKEGHLIGAAFTRSPEALLQLSWGTPTDVWSFGNMVRVRKIRYPLLPSTHLSLDS